MLPTHGPDEIIPKCTLKPDCARMNPGSYIHRSHVNLGDPFAQIPHHGIDPSHLRMREDSACTRKLRSAGTLATMHAPHLYYYMAHGNNTFGSDHFALMAKQASMAWKVQGDGRRRRALTPARRQRLIRVFDAMGLASKQAPHNVPW
mmetsp:Transcript_50286/g.112968  ORF Transcript_50286/g.112968 Transcript_50286/m.112968 type:complete len:147 (+) Transcript_50286:101-541(+)